MRKFNEEDFKSVEHLEEKFETAIKSRYVTGLTKPDFDKLIVIYKDCLGRQANISCSACVLQMMTQVGRLYLSFKEENKTKTITDDEIKRQGDTGDSKGRTTGNRRGGKEKSIKGSKGNKS